MLGKNVAYGVFGSQPVEHYSSQQNVLDLESVGNFKNLHCIQICNNKYKCRLHLIICVDDDSWDSPLTCATAVLYNLRFAAPPPEIQSTVAPLESTLFQYASKNFINLVSLTTMPFFSFRGRHSGKGPAAVSSLLS